MADTVSPQEPVNRATRALIQIKQEQQGPQIKQNQSNKGSTSN